MMNAATTSVKPRSYYFAYGSLLAREEIAKTTPGAIPIAIALLLHYRLVFNKHSTKWGGDAANIVEDAKAVVWGYVYEVNNEERQRLISREIGYELVEDLTVITEQPGEPATQRQVFSFQATTICAENCGPMSAYVQTIVQGARQRKLPEEYIKTIQAFDPDHPTESKE